MALKDHNQQLTRITTETTSTVSSENQIISRFPLTTLTLLAVFFSLSIVANMIFVTCYTVRRRKRKKSRKKGETLVAAATNLEERVPLSLQEPSVMEVKDDVCKPGKHANLIQKTETAGSSDSGVDIRVQANLSLETDFNETSQEISTPGAEIPSIEYNKQDKKSEKIPMEITSKDFQTCYAI